VRRGADGQRRHGEAAARLAEAQAERREKTAATVSEQILICYDGSAEAERALERASALLVHRHAVVLTVSRAMTFAEGVAATSSLVPGTAFEDLNRADALKLAEAGAAHARRAGVDAEARATIAPTTWEGIVEVADELDVAAIVMGSHGVRGFRDRSNGSVSHAVATHARRPVLIVP
jgi:nucleotide-binding universal stress UspA family protein